MNYCVGDTSLYRPKHTMSMFAQAMRTHAAAEKDADEMGPENVPSSSSQYILQNNQLKQQTLQQEIEQELQKQQLINLQSEEESQRHRLKQTQRSFTYGTERRISIETDAIDMEMENDDNQQVRPMSGKRSREQFEREFMFTETFEMSEI
jgi:hypothetical protein